MFKNVIFLIILQIIFSACINSNPNSTNNPASGFDEKNIKKDNIEIINITNIPFVKISKDSFFSSINNFKEKIEIPNTFLMSQFEVTNKIFLEVINNTKDIALSGDGIEYIHNAEKHTVMILTTLAQYTQIGLELKDNKLKIKSKKENHPVAGVQWVGALIFCNELSKLNNFSPVYNLNDLTADFSADGFRLPTELEWEYAARGNTKNIYPWGNDINKKYANYFKSNDPFEENFPFNSGNGPTTPIGYFNGELYNNFQTISNQSPFGVYDMIGNINEWCWNDSQTFKKLLDDFYPKASQNENKVLRGGSFFKRIKYNQIDNRYITSKYSYLIDGGIRLVKKYDE